MRTYRVGNLSIVGFVRNECIFVNKLRIKTYVVIHFLLPPNSRGKIPDISGAQRGAVKGKEGNYAIKERKELSNPQIKKPEGY